MARLPFNPDNMAIKREKPPETALTVSQLARRLSDALQAGFPAPVRVAGEVSGYKPGGGQHWYFSLKDAEAVIPCVMFAQSARACALKLADGQQVVVTGRPDFWAKGGRASLIVTRIEPVGEGALDAAFRALCDDLRAKGWFAPERKRPVPEFPRRIAVVTSRTGAALQDVLDTMRRRCCVGEVLLVDVPVQGQGAAAHVARALHWLGTVHQAEGIDAILLTRGGGSKEDLWTFNERAVAAAIVQSPVPVVAAIGHEVDVTIAELVADLRCATPTQAAMRLTPDSTALLEQLDAASNQLRRALLRSARENSARLTGAARHLAAAVAAATRHEAHRLDRAAGKLERQRPVEVVARRLATLRSSEDRLARAVRQRLARRDLLAIAGRLARAASLALQRAGGRAQAAERQLAAVGPMSVLQRGFSYTVRDDGRLVRSAAEVRPGEHVRTHVADGAFGSTVDGPLPSRAQRRSAAPAAPPGPDQMDLFRAPR